MPDVKRASWRFSFEDFVVGPSNELAYAATRGLSHKTLDSDQLFLSSSPGLGKTHLLQAVGRQFCTTSNRDRVRVEYLTAESFCTQLIMALRSKQMDQFKARFREGLDVLLLEDIHFLQGKEKIQAELLETLKYLEGRGAKVVLSSSFLPRELNAVDTQLASRFCSGFLARIDKPDFDTRRRILAHKANTYQVQLGEDVTELLADRIRYDVRQLESCLQNLVLKARLLNCKISMEMALQVVENYTPAGNDLDMDGIVHFVCESYELSKDQLASKSRKRNIVLARNLAFFLARKYTDLSLKDIGERFNRRHSTVLKGITNVEREVNLETPLGRQLSRTMQMAEHYSGSVS
jgi:chromosomal replication initiator protein